MTAATVAFDLVKPPSPAGGMSPDRPRIIYGTGTPAGTISPWSGFPKGSIWIATDQTNVAAWLKVQANSAVADWHLLGGIKNYESPIFNIDNGAGTAADDIVYFPRAAEILTATAVYTEATDASGAAEANVKIGTAAAGEEVVAATALTVSKAIGSTQTLTIVDGTIAAGGFANIRHTGLAATEAGQYKVHLTYLEY